MKPRLALAALALVALTAAGCGGASYSRSPKTGTSPQKATGAGQPADHAAPAGLAALRAASAPASWRSVTIATGATLFYPPGWRLTHGDRGTATAVTLGAGGRIAGYLNLTPRQGAERLHGWSSFRIAHNRAEGALDVRREAARAGVHFRTGIGSCVRDSYTTVTHARYVEIACLVRDASGGSVIVAASPPAQFGGLLPQLDRAISALTS